ncbi:hypothetical protein RJ639_045556 [Escallonia herrerae]|uniref:Cytochrome P450 n=1 Tax=Escallonia herrerae TaxID=1293975 RepID=A0AA89AZW5_9ASTE|nr:hypothetical protein RJ639_045556 [Escallonia herrerae]
MSSLQIMTGVTSSTNEQSKVIRKQLPAVLKLENLINHIGMMDTVMKQQLHTEWNRKKITVVPTVTKFTLTLSCRFFLGIEDPKMVEEIDVSIKDIDPGIMSIPINFPGTYFNRAIKASKVMRDKIKLFVRQAKNDLQEGSASESKSFMMHMLRTADENGQFYNESYVAHNVYGLVEGGYGTLTSILTFIMKYLSEFPHVYDEVLEGKAHTQTQFYRDAILFMNQFSHNSAISLGNRIDEQRFKT